MVYIFPFSSSRETCNKHNIRSLSSYSRAQETNNELCKCQRRTVTTDYFHVSVGREKRSKIICLADSKLVRVEEEEEQGQGDMSSGVLDLE